MSHKVEGHLVALIRIRVDITRFCAESDKLFPYNGIREGVTDKLLPDLPKRGAVEGNRFCPFVR